MVYASLYRKYRPADFSEVIGQTVVVRTLGNMVKHNSISHAYLFTGTRGTGKTSVARIFAKAVNCTDPQNGSPCCRCEACKAFESSQGVDFVEMDAASNNGVDDIRALREAVQYPPASDKLRYKVYIIDEVHQLSSTAFNAFLKTLEEPPSYCIFILATTEVQKLPQTILSRCLRFDFSLVSQEELAAHVGRIFDKEGITYTQDALLAIARAGQGSVRDTLSVADTCLTASEGHVNYQNVLDVLGANDPTVIASLSKAILDGDLARSLRSVEEISTKGKNIVVLSRDIALYMRNLLILKADDSANDYLHLPEQSIDAAKEILLGCDRATIVRVLSIFNGLDTSMRYSSNPRTVLETAIAKATTSIGSDLSDLIGKVSLLEKKLAQCASDIKNGVRVLPAETLEQPKETQEEQVQLNDEVSDDIFSDDPIATMPTDTMSSNAVAVQYRTALAVKFADKKYLMLSTMMTGAFVRIEGNKVVFSFQQENDRAYFERNSAVIAELSKDLLPFDATFDFVFNPRKHMGDDDINNLINIVGAGKVTKK